MFKSVQIDLIPNRDLLVEVAEKPYSNLEGIADSVHTHAMRLSSPKPIQTAREIKKDNEPLDRYLSPLNIKSNVVKDLKSRIIRHKKTYIIEKGSLTKENAPERNFGNLNNRWTNFELKMYKNSKGLQLDR